MSGDTTLPGFEVAGVYQPELELPAWKRYLQGTPADEYFVPSDPMDNLSCEACQ